MCLSVVEKLLISIITIKWQVVLAVQLSLVSFQEISDAVGYGFYKVHRSAESGDALGASVLIVKIVASVSWNLIELIYRVMIGLMLRLRVVRLWIVGVLIVLLVEVWLVA